MKKARLIYNPVAGKKGFATKLDGVIARFQAKGWQIVPYRTTGKETSDTFARILSEGGFEAVFVAGGDGTINQVVNGMLNAALTIPLGIFPVGTSNDFAVHLNLPNTVDECCKVILKENITCVDVGWANGKHFLNVASAGLLSDVPRKTDVALKNVLGKLAYYVKGIEAIPNFKSIPVEIVSKSTVLKEEMLLFLIVNGCTAGSFSRLAPRASIVDGVFDVLVFKSVNLGQFFALFLKVLKGEHINDPRVEYFQTDRLIINCSGELDTDLDGEVGPEFPLEIKVLPGRLPVFTPENKIFTEKKDKGR